MVQTAGQRHDFHAVQVSTSRSSIKFCRAPVATHADVSWLLKRSILCIIVIMMRSLLMFLNNSIVDTLLSADKELC